MAVPFSIPDEQNDSDIILTQRLLDLYQLLYEILLQRQPLTPLDDTLQSVVNEQTENEVVTTLETPFVEYDVQTQVKKKKVNRRRFKTEEIVVPDAPTVPEQRSICPDWIGVGRNLRKIADNFHKENLAPVINVHLNAIPSIDENTSSKITTIIDETKSWNLSRKTIIDKKTQRNCSKDALCNPKNLSLSSSPVSRRRPMLAYRNYHPTLSEPRPPVSHEPENTDIPVDAFEIDATWSEDLNGASKRTERPKDVTIEPPSTHVGGGTLTPLSTSTELSFPSPFLEATNSFLKIKQKISSPLSPLKSALSEWWLSSSSSTKSKTDDQQYTFHKRPLDFPRIDNVADDLTTANLRPSRPKSMLDQYLPILTETEPQSMSLQSIQSKHRDDRDRYKSQSSTSDIDHDEDDPYFIKSTDSILDTNKTNDFYVSRSLFDDNLSKINTPGPSSIVDSTSTKSSLLSSGYRPITPVPRGKTCTHEIDTEVTNDCDRTYFWRKTILAPTKLTINTADYHLPQEAAEEYCYGGYEKVEIGQTYLDRYLIIRKIGWGHFSTVWLSGDKLLKRLVAIKIVKSGKIFSETAQDEISLLRDVSIVGTDNKKFDYFVRIYDQFEFRGDNGKHKAIVFELLGCNLYKLTTLTLGIGVDMTYVKIITRQVLEGLVFLHEECGIIHTDIKPENILIAGSPEYHRKVVLNVAKWLQVDMPWPKQFVSNWNEDRDYILSKKVKNDIKEFLKSIHISRCSCNNDQFNHNDYIKRLNEIFNSNTQFTKDFPPEINVFHVPSPKNLRIKIADLGNACYDHTHFCDQIQTCQYRGPETILGAKYTYSADIWSLACVVFELAAGDYLFDPRASSKGEYSCDDDHLAHMIELLGPMPDNVWKCGKWSDKFFTNDGKLRRISELNPWSIAQVLEEKYEFSDRDAVDFAAFLKPMLDFDAKTRVSARECLKHPWLNI